MHFLPDHFNTTTLQNHPYGASIRRILAAAINAVEPGQAVQRHVQRSGNRLQIDGQTYDLTSFKHIRVLGVGKAALSMTTALAGLLDGWPVEGLIVTKHATGTPLHGFQIIEGGHPVPDNRSLLAGEKAYDLARSLTPDDLLICLVSGGGSALMTSPRLPLTDLQTLTSALLASGTPIDEINTLRRHLDRVKGGGLAVASNGATILSLILSDVIGNPLAAIASGPTAPDPSTIQDARRILTNYQLDGQMFTPVLNALESAPENPKPGNPLFDRVQNLVIASNQLAANAAIQQAIAEGFHTRLLRTDLEGEARIVATQLAEIMHKAADPGSLLPNPSCQVAGGETTVTISGAGLGGRNQELALAASLSIAGLPNSMLISLATDGEDGPTDAAGAVVTGETQARAQAMGLDPAEYLRLNDSHTFFKQIGDALTPGPTGTNVNDLTFVFLF